MLIFEAQLIFKQNVLVYLFVQNDVMILIKLEIFFSDQLTKVIILSFFQGKITLANSGLLARSIKNYNNE